MAKGKNHQFRMKMFLILVEYPQLNTKEIFDKYLESNPKSVPPMNRFSQLLKHKWFSNVGLHDVQVNNKRARYAVWEVKQIYREYPPQWTPKSGRIIHQGGPENYSDLDQLNDDLQQLECWEMAQDEYEQNPYEMG